MCLASEFSLPLLCARVLNFIFFGRKKITVTVPVPAFFAPFMLPGYTLLIREMF
jgi:hypothetical protein